MNRARGVPVGGVGGSGGAPPDVDSEQRKEGRPMASKDRGRKEKKKPKKTKK
jgi:hypothetical protein